MKLNFETTQLPDDYVRDVWKKYPRESYARKYAEAIEKMKVGQSFEVEDGYNVAESIRQAFRARGWRCTMRTKGSVPWRWSDRNYRIFKIRVWRLA